MADLVPEFYLPVLRERERECVYLCVCLGLKVERKPTLSVLWD